MNRNGASMAVLILGLLVTQARGQEEVAPDALPRLPEGQTSTLAGRQTVEPRSLLVTAVLREPFPPRGSGDQEGAWARCMWMGSERRFFLIRRSN